MNKHDLLAKEIDLQVAKQKLVCAIEEINLKMANLQYDYLGARIAEEAEETGRVNTQLTQLVKVGAEEINKNAIAEARAMERAEILSALHTALYMIPADAPASVGLTQAIVIINTRG